MKFLLIAFLFVLPAKMALAQIKDNPASADKPSFKIILKGLDLNGGVKTDSFASVIRRSYNDTLSISSLGDNNSFKVISFDITIAHRRQNLMSFHSSDGVLKKPFYNELSSCHQGDVIYFDNVYFIKNGIQAKAADIAFKLM